MREFFTSVLAGVASAVVWETIRWVFASIRAQKSPLILTRPSGLDTLRGTVRFRPPQFRIVA